MADIERLLESLTAEGGGARPASHPYLLGVRWALAAAVYLSVLLTVSGVRPDLAQALRHPWYVAELAALSLLFLSAALSAALLAFPDLHQKRRLAFAPLGVFVLFLLLLMCAWNADDPPAPLPPHSFQCTLCITLAAVPPAIWAFISLRRHASTHPRPAGGVSLLFAFGVGALWLRLHEVNDSVIHVVVWHYLPMLAAGGAGLWLGQRLLRW